ncbi:ArsC family reductase [Alcanivorax marinus]|uniref:ArsC family reductase n=1 Tax=Alloalcanivorax marinus TaxID=1177169 RepID=A0A9Q3UM38_9GAMM|nr:ArsC family reductase [Alloalcanivorax marinus]MCC4307714.1 ArsC family reductase [Alloalcanivorax marinus]
MAITIYGIKNCDTMKKARAWLDQQGVDYRFHDYRQDGVPEPALRQWIADLGWDTVINRRGTTWRKLDPEVRENMDADAAAEQALANPSLIKRPILETDDHLRAGFNADEWKTLIQ